MPARTCSEWRRKLGTFVEFDRYDPVSRTYTVVITILTFVSLLPLCLTESNPVIDAIQIPIGLVFLFDYIGRWMTADIRDPDDVGARAFITYPIGFWAIIDLLSLVSFLPIIPTALRMIRLLRLFRLILIVELLRYSRGFYIMYEAIDREKHALIAVLVFMLVYIFMIALLMFNIEPDLFGSMYDAMYWSATSLATIGYGDFAPQTTIGRVVNFISSIVGIAVVALPTGIITSAYVTTLHELRDRYAPAEQKKTVIDKLAQQKADELGVDVSTITTDDIFGRNARKTARDYNTTREDNRKDGNRKRKGK